MPVIRIVHHGRKWARVRNHLDGHHCPHCAATIHGPEAQRTHEQEHLRTWQMIEAVHLQLIELAARAGLELVEQPDETWSWGATVTGVESDTVDDAAQLAPPKWPQA